MDEQFPELESFDSTFKPSEGGIKPGLEVLPDGDYHFQILRASLDRTQKTNDLILRQALRVLSAPSMVQMAVGKEVERVYFFKTEMNVAILGGDLCRLGFDADKWTQQNGRPFSKELKQILPKLTGMKFHAKKVTNPNKQEPEKPYHNLYIQGVVNSTSPPNTLPAAPANDPNDIPF